MFARRANVAVNIPGSLAVWGLLILKHVARGSYDRFILVVIVLLSTKNERIRFPVWEIYLYQIMFIASILAFCELNLSLNRSNFKTAFKSNKWYFKSNSGETLKDTWPLSVTSKFKSTVVSENSVEHNSSHSLWLL